MLDVSINIIGDTGATEIAEALKTNKSLANLKLRYSRIDDTGATEIAEAENQRILDES